MAFNTFLRKGEYLGDLNRMLNCSGIAASAVSATSRVPGHDIPHRHENPILSLILDGYSIERIGRAVGPRVPGDLKFYGAGELHQVTIDRFPSRNINIEIESDFLREHEVTDSDIAAAAANGPITKLAFLRTYPELLISDQLSDSAIRMTFLGMLRPLRTRRRYAPPSWVRQVRNVLNDRWNENITLDVLAAEIGVHPVTVSKYFPTHFSSTLGSYVRQIRIEKSLALIKGSDLPLTEIAHQCGFADQSHFSRTFRHYTGMQPKAFRKF